jgi:hypothetical protein
MRGINCETNTVPLEYSSIDTSNFFNLLRYYNRAHWYYLLSVCVNLTKEFYVYVWSLTVWRRKVQDCSSSHQVLRARMLCICGPLPLDTETGQRQIHVSPYHHHTQQYPRLSSHRDLGIQFAVLHVSR